jgi:hypothetical protein
MRVPLRPQITIKNIIMTHQRELRFLGTYIKKNINWGAHVRLLRAKLCKVVYMVKPLKKLSPYMMRNIYYSNLLSCLRHDVILWGGDNGSKNIFKLQKMVLRTISGVNNHT